MHRNPINSPTPNLLKRGYLPRQQIAEAIPCCPSPKPETLNTKPYTPSPENQASPKPETLDTRPQTPSPENQTPNPKKQTPNPKNQTPNPKNQTPNLKHQTPNPRRALQKRIVSIVRLLSGPEPPNLNSKPPNPLKNTPQPLQLQTPNTENPTPKHRIPGPVAGRRRHRAYVPYEASAVLRPSRGSTSIKRRHVRETATIKKVTSAKPPDVAPLMEVSRVAVRIARTCHPQRQPFCVHQGGQRPSKGFTPVKPPILPVHDSRWSPGQDET